MNPLPKFPIAQRPSVLASITATDAPTHIERTTPRVVIHQYPDGGVTITLMGASHGASDTVSLHTVALDAPEWADFLAQLTAP